MSSSKRASTAPAPPKPPTTLSPTLTIADNALLTGAHRITLGSNTVIHPRTRLTSTYGSITIGNNCIIGERALIGLQSSSRDDEEGILIENDVIVEVGAAIEASRIGDGCVIEVGAKVGRGVVLGKHCKIGPLCEILDGDILPDFTVVYGNGQRRVDRGGVEQLQKKMVGRQVDIMKKLIPSHLAKFQ